MDSSESDLKSHLDDLLAEPVGDARERERTAFDREVAPFQGSFVLFGAGNMGRQILARLRADGIEPHAFSDNNPTGWGKTIDGLPVLPPQEAAAKFGRSAAFIVTIYNHGHSFPDTRDQLTALGCEKVVSVLPIRWKYHETFLPHFRDDLPHKVLESSDAIRASMPLWLDSLSRNEFVAQVAWRLHGRFDLLSKSVQDEQYFSDDLVRLSGDEFFVDVGAYDGDTIRAFLAYRGGAFRRIVALEPDPANLRRLREFVSSLPDAVQERIHIQGLATGAEQGRVTFDSGQGTSSAVKSEGGIEVECVKLDDLLEGEHPTYIKLDIEGAEPDTLAGARRIISEDHPALAVCVYHKQDHLWSIPLQIRQYYRGYQLKLRPHMTECWETVCYAIPAEKRP